MQIAGLDIGTTACKITVYSEKGGLLSKEYKEYPVSRTSSEHETEAEAIWQAVREIVSNAAKKHGGIKGIGLASFGESFVMLDGDDKPLFPVLLNTDPRGGEECAELTNAIGKKKLSYITGLNPHHMYTLPKLMWIKKHRPEVYEKTKRICLIEDFILYMLTGEAKIDYALASRTMAFDIRSLCWSDEILTVAGIDKSLFSPPVPIGGGSGNIRFELAAELGLPSNTKIIAAGHDQVAAAIGSGVFDENTAVDGSGTVECITPVFDSIPENDIMSDCHYSAVPFLDGKYVTYAFLFTGGALLKWFTDNLAGYAYNEAKEKGTDIYSQLESERSEPTGLLVLPHFAGAATPYMDSGSKGAILGLSLSNTAQDIFVGIMEGICYEMLVNKEYLNRAGIRFDRLIATGGGAKSKIWLQMKADILGVPVTSLESEEAGATGSAMLAGIEVGIFKDMKDASSVMIREKQTFYPNAAISEKYAEVYKRYLKLYNAARPLF